MASLINSFVFLFTLCSAGNANGFEAEESTKDFQFHTVQLSSLLPSSTCIRSTQTGSRAFFLFNLHKHVLYFPALTQTVSAFRSPIFCCKDLRSYRKFSNFFSGLKEGAMLEVAHKQGPCSSLNQQGKPSSFSLAEVIKHDKSRVDFLRHKHKKPKVATLPSANHYIVTVGLGKPVKKVPLSFDTGSDLAWTQCKPCFGHCFKQTSPIFDPAKSSTFKTLTCSSPSCFQNTTGYVPFCKSKRCKYGLKYGDGSISTGFLSKERLTLTPSHVVDDFLFGCGGNNSGIFNEYESGILGLGHDPVSIVQQTAKKFHKVFSYCVPSNPSYTGFLRFGGKIQKSFVFTPLSKNVNTLAYYGIDILGIKLGGKKLPIPTSVFTKGGAIIDSGTVITRLPSEAYNILRGAYRKALSHYKFVNPKDILEEGVSLIDTCHSLGNSHESMNLPTVSFLFGGGAVVDLPPVGLIVTYNSTVFCLAFSGQNLGGVGTIFGSCQQQTLEVVYDLSKGRIGFGPPACK